MCSNEKKVIEEDWRKVGLLMKECLEIVSHASEENKSKLNYVREMLDGARSTIARAVGEENIQKYISNDTMGRWEKGVKLSKLEFSFKEPSGSSKIYSEIVIDEVDEEDQPLEVTI